MSGNLKWFNAIPIMILRVPTDAWKLTTEVVPPPHQNQDLKMHRPLSFLLPLSPLLSPFCLFTVGAYYRLWFFFTFLFSTWHYLSGSLSFCLCLSLSLSLCPGGCRWRASILWCFPCSLSLSLSFPNVELSFLVHSWFQLLPLSLSLLVSNNST